MLRGHSFSQKKQSLGNSEAALASNLTNIGVQAAYGWDRTDKGSELNVRAMHIGLLRTDKMKYHQDHIKTRNKNTVVACFKTERGRVIFCDNLPKALDAFLPLYPILSAFMGKEGKFGK